MSKLFTKVNTVRSLGAKNFLLVIIHRISKKYGFYSRPHEQKEILTGSFFAQGASIKTELVPTLNWQKIAKYFGYHSIPVTENPPDWHFNPLTKKNAPASLAWWRIPDFDPTVGDIKGIWEASRFEWVLSFAQSANLGDEKSLEKLNFWLEDWCKHNPPYYGVNWKCGQEAGIRVMHLAMAAILLEQVQKPTSNLIDLIKMHLSRIKLTLAYAIAQDNNHGTSEAAALFIGGSWLEYLGHHKGQQWRTCGQKWLENRVLRLIAADGSFSQHSLNYHRVVLDTLSMVEIWRRYLSLPPFSKAWKARVQAATYWLANLINPHTGDGPNVGANDGARLFPITDTDYRDYRPSVQLAMRLFNNQKAYEGEGSWNLPLKWFNINDSTRIMDAPKSTLFDEGGYALLRRPNVFALIRYPRFRFRPSQADALHLDLWIRDENVLRDAGSYSYNAEPNWSSYFPGTASHNTIQFDNRNQMSRLSRFLFGDWIKVKSLEPLQDHEEAVSFGVSYQDAYKATHERFVMLTNNILKIEDKINGFINCAVLRWRLKPDDWKIEGHTLTNGKQTIKVSATVPIVRFELVDGWESRYYLQKNKLPVLEVEVHQAGILVTEYSW
ncbi:heparinase II/III family protein [Legionella jamestowniensis]|uniref:Heparinase II/III-like protein n=1 Tax=Legionella jamestowniensis TaxID=455 RepID=A0A0W0UFX1_9GAMM|nr:heparinase II/III-family protein [Legionella jamestowniensis]KTD06816.1 Heparinase II/III-like protein [Legionella jamestowniensis]SFL82767.1 Heparinase II/III N-terminus [Legionella jamestowniensis DSM 19215]